MDHLKQYWDNYAQKSPLREFFIKETGLLKPGYTAEELNDLPNLTPVNAQNFPKLQEALEEECKLRDVEKPACYIDNQCRLGYSRADRYAIFIEDRAYDKFSKDELRALVAHEIKHLYQSPSNTPEESRLNEYDCDRAAVSSTNYDTICSYVHKGAELQIEQMLKNPLMKQFALTTFNLCPGLIAKNFWFRLDSLHPSPASRLRAMQQHDTKPRPSPLP